MIPWLNSHFYKIIFIFFYSSWHYKYYFSFQCRFNSHITPKIASRVCSEIFHEQRNSFWLTSKNQSGNFHRNYFRSFQTFFNQVSNSFRNIPLISLGFPPKFPFRNSKFLRNSNIFFKSLKEYFKEFFHLFI